MEIPQKGDTVTFRGESAEVISFHPDVSGVCDTLIRLPEGETMVAAHELRPVGAPYSSRAMYRAAMVERRNVALSTIERQHVAGFKRETWPGMEFGRALFGEMVQRAKGSP